MAKQIDRRIIFLLIFLGVALPLIITIGFRLETTKIVENVFQMVDNTPSGSTVLISFDYDPASKPELHPMGKALLYHCFKKDQKVVITALWPMGVVMAQEILKQLKEDFPDKVYGIDFVNLGYKAGGMVTIQAMGKNFRSVFPKDMNGTKLEELPIMNDINNYEKFGFVFSLSAGAPGIKEWVMVAHDKFGKQTAGGVTAVSAPAMLPYVNEQHQLTGLLGGLKGAAEYEMLIKNPGTATSGMDAQSIAHIIIIVFIIIGNINYYRNKKNLRK
jgi:hypothetical protein